MNKYRMKKPMWTAMLNVSLVLVLITLVGAVALFYQRPCVSEVEKRELQTFPHLSIEALCSGAYTQQISDFFADTFPGREMLVRMASIVRESRGIRLNGIRLHEGGAGEAPQPQNTLPPAELPPPHIQPETSLVSQDPASEASPSGVEDDRINGVRIGAVFLYKGRGFQLFGGNEAAGQRYAATLNRYQEELGDRVQIYNLLVPSAISFGIPPRYQSMTTPEQPRIQAIYEELNPNIRAVNIYDSFASHKDEYLYFGTDHHWTSLAAYYAYVEFCKSAGLEAVDINQLEKRTLHGFLGTLYAQTQDSQMREMPDHVDYYMMPTTFQCYQYRKNQPFTPYPVSLYGEYAKPINSYSVFLHGDFPVTRIETSIKNGRRIAVVKESYGNAFVPWLVNHYEQVLVIDQRYVQVGLLDLMQENGTTELLFLNNIFAAHTTSHVRELSHIMHQRYTPQITQETETSVPTHPEQSAAPGEDEIPEAEHAQNSATIAILGTEE